MRSIYVTTLILLTALAVAPAGAHPPGQTPEPQKTAQPPRPEPPGSAVNVKVEVTISEAMGSSPGTKKVVTLVTSDRANGVIRSSGDVRVADRYRSVAINVDARPVVIRDGTLRLDLALEYQPQATSGADKEPGLWRVTERVNVLLQSDKPLLISETFDPSSERRVTVEVKATIVK